MKTRPPRRLFRSRPDRSPPPGPALRPSQEAQLRRIARDGQHQPCILCGGPPMALGIWTPTAVCNRRLGAPSGKQRVAAYTVCERHAAPEHAAAIEAAILADARRDLARPATN